MKSVNVYKEKDKIDGKEFWKVVVDGVPLNETFQTEKEAEDKGKSVQLLWG